MNTVYTLNPFDRFNSDITAQQVFDHVVSHLATMTERSLRTDTPDSDSCAYRGQNNSKCAAGYLLADYEYSSVMEGMPFRHRRMYIPARLMPHRNLIAELQGVHDSRGNWTLTRMKQRLQEVAYDHCLDNGMIHMCDWKMS